MSTTVRVAVVGAGVIGLSIAWRAAVAGFDVVLVDPQPGSGASWAAGGMLAPVTEAWPGEEPLLEFGSASLERWPDYARALHADSGSDPGLRTDGTVAVSVDSADRDELAALAGHLAALGREVHQLTGREVRRLEPSLGPAVRSGLSVPGDLSVDNRALLDALRRAAQRLGVRHVPVAAASVGPGPQVLLVDKSTVDADVVVLAAGAWSGRLCAALDGLIHPVKGEILRLGARQSALPPPARTVRGLVRGRQVYLVPRSDGLVIGATQYESGFDTEVRVGGVRDLLADAEELVPAIAEYALVESAAGLRPGSRDNLPLLGWLDQGLLVATGHHRNGILLAPITAEVVLNLVQGKDIPAEAKVADPARLLDDGTQPVSGVWRGETQ